MTIPIELVDEGGADGLGLLCSSSSTNGRSWSPILVAVSFTATQVTALAPSRTVVIMNGAGGGSVGARVHEFGTMRHWW